MKTNAAFNIDRTSDALLINYNDSKNPVVVSELHQEILLTLRNQWEFPGDRITIKENNGWVILGGEVPWNFQRKAAKAAILLLPAVKGVIDNLYALSQARDERDKIMLETGLANSLVIRNNNIKVDVTDREVTLSGTVGSNNEKEEAERISWSIPGIFVVDNELTIAS